MASLAWLPALSLSPPANSPHLADRRATSLLHHAPTRALPPPPPSTVASRRSGLLPLRRPSLRRIPPRIAAGNLGVGEKREPIVPPYNVLITGSSKGPDSSRDSTSALPNFVQVLRNPLDFYPFSILLCLCLFVYLFDDL